MITTNLIGGLGNQMFQMAAAYGLYRDLKKQFPLIYRNLDCGFNFNNCYTPLQGNTSMKYKESFYKNFKLLKSNPDKVHNEIGFSYNRIPILSNYENELVLNGYFQSEKYFKEYKNDLKKLFGSFSMGSKANILSYLMNLGHNKLTAVHVRRGDYINPPEKEKFHFNLGKTDYYKKAMDIIDDGAFIFVSDDIEWCKENFKGDNIFYSPFTEELDDLLLMIKCDNQIIANSSFSWWGAWLSENNKVIAPNNWFGPKGPKDTQDLIPENWIKI